MSDAGGSGLRAAHKPTRRVARMPEPGALVGDHYLLGPDIGRGGVGIVFEARDQRTDTPVALKILLPEVLDKDTIVERFRREARLASTLVHPNTVRIEGYGVHGDSPDTLGLPFIAMELLSGEDLEARLDRKIKLPTEEALTLARQTLESLAEAHAKGIIHRDIKPQNTFLVTQPDGTNRVKVLDFGIAKVVSLDGEEEPSRFESLTETGLVCGTPQFMAPEQAEGRRDLTPAVDVYNLACVLFRMITGDLLFQGTTPYEVAYQHVMAPLPPFPPELDNPLGDVLKNALTKIPEDRIPDAAALIIALDDAARQMGMTPAPSTTPPPPPDLELPRPLSAPPTAPKPQPWGLWLGLAVIAAVIAASILAVLVWFFALR